MSFISVLAFFFFFSWELSAQQASSFEGQHRDVQTQAGKFSLGVSALDSDPLNQKTSGIAELGYVLQSTPDEFSSRAAELVPFIRNHFESGEAGLEASTTTGVGMDLRLRELRSNLNLVLRVAIDETDPRNRPSSDSPIESSAGVFFTGSFGGQDEQNAQVRRIRKLIEPHPIVIPVSEQMLDWNCPTTEERQLLNSLMIDLYILKVREAKDEYQISDPDPFLSPGSRSLEKREWLEEHLSLRYPLYLLSESSDKIYSYRIGSKLDCDEDKAFLACHLIDDFLDEAE